MVAYSITSAQPMARDLPNTAVKQAVPIAGTMLVQALSSLISSEKILQNLSGPNTLSSPPSQDFELNLSPQAREVLANLEIKAQALSEALQQVKAQDSLTPVMNLAQGDESMALLLAKINQMGLLPVKVSGGSDQEHLAVPETETVTETLPGSTQTGVAGSSDPKQIESKVSSALQPMTQGKVTQALENLVQLIKVSVNSLAEKMPDIFSKPNLAGLSDVNPVENPGTTIPGSAAQPIQAVSLSKEQALPIPEVIEGLRRLDSVGKVMDAHLLKTDLILASSRQITSLLNAGTALARGDNGKNPVVGNLPDSAAKIPAEIDPPSTALSGTTAGTGAGTTAGLLTQSMPPSDQLSQMLQQFNQSGNSLTAQGQAQLGRLTQVVQQIQENLREGPVATTTADKMGLATDNTALAADKTALATGNDSGNLSRATIQQMVGRGFVFELQVNGKADLAPVVKQLHSIGVQAEPMKGDAQSTTTLRITMPGQSAGQGAPVVLDLSRQGRPTGAENKVATAPTQHKMTAGSDPAATEVIDKSSMDRFVPIHPNSAGGSERGADRGDTQSAAHSRIEEYTHPEAMRMNSSLPTNSSVAFQSAIQTRMVAFYSEYHEAVVQGKDSVPMKEAFPVRLGLEYKPIEVLAPDPGQASSSAGIHFVNPLETAESDAVAVR